MLLKYYVPVGLDADRAPQLKAIVRRHQDESYATHRVNLSMLLVGLRP